MELLDDYLNLILFVHAAVGGVVIASLLSWMKLNRLRIKQIEISLDSESHDEPPE